MIYVFDRLSHLEGLFAVLARIRVNDTETPFTSRNLLLFVFLINDLTYGIAGQHC